MNFRRTYFNTCSRCGANLDPGERCECERRLDDLRQYETPIAVVMMPRKETRVNQAQAV